MRRFLILALMVIVSVAAEAKIPLRDRMAGHRVTFDYLYNEVAGKVVVQGNAYKLTGMGLEIVSDGKTRWTVDRKAREVVVEAVDGVDLLTNPALLVKYYRFSPERVKVHAAGEDSLDVSVTLSDGSVARIRLSDIVFADEGELDDFVLDPGALGDGFVVTDLR